MEKCRLSSLISCQASHYPINVNDIFATLQYWYNMYTNTEEFDISFGRNILKNEFGDRAEWEMMSFHVWISSKNSNIKYNQNKEIQQCVYTFKF